jgi:hypothetical protein
MLAGCLLMILSVVPGPASQLPHCSHAISMWITCPHVQEPVQKWTNIPDADDDEMSPSQKNGGNLLSLFYKDSERWAYTCTYICFVHNYTTCRRT